MRQEIFCIHWYSMSITKWNPFNFLAFIVESSTLQILQWRTNKQKKEEKQIAFSFELIQPSALYDCMECTICCQNKIKQSNTVIKGVANNRALAEWYNNIVRFCQCCCCCCHHHRLCNCLYTHGVMFNDHSNRLPQTNQRRIAFHHFIVLSWTLFKPIKRIHVLFPRASSSFVFLCKSFFHWREYLCFTVSAFAWYTSQERYKEAIKFFFSHTHSRSAWYCLELSSRVDNVDLNSST